MTPITIDPHAVRWGPASTSWLLPPTMLAPAEAGAVLSLTASVRQLRWAFTVALLPESKTRPRAEAKWHRDFDCALSERDWSDAWLSVHKAPTSGKVRSFLWKLMHRRLPLLCYDHIALLYGRGDTCPLCSLSSETAIHLLVECETADLLWQMADDLAEEMGCPLPSDPRSRILGATPSESLCQALLSRLDIPADNPPPSTHTVNLWIRESWSALRGVTMAAIWNLRCSVLYRPTPLSVLIVAATSAIRDGLKASKLVAQSSRSSYSSISPQKKAFLSATWLSSSLEVTD